MGLIPMTPARRGLNSSPSHTDARCNLPKFPKSLAGSAQCCRATALALTFYRGKSPPPFFLWSWCHGWVGWGTIFFPFLGF